MRPSTYPPNRNYFVGVKYDYFFSFFRWLRWKPFWPDHVWPFWLSTHLLTRTSDTIKYVGHVFRNLPVSLQPGHIQQISDYPTPKSLANRQISWPRNILIIFYLNFVYNFESIAHPLNKVKRKTTQFIWVPDHNKTLHTLKSRLTNNLIFQTPDFTKRLIVHFDDCCSAVGTSMSQDYKCYLIPIAFASWNNLKHNYSTMKLECFWLLLPFKNSQQYIEHSELFSYTDNSVDKTALK